MIANELELIINKNKITMEKRVSISHYILCLSLVVMLSLTEAEEIEYNEHGDDWGGNCAVGMK